MSTRRDFVGNSVALATVLGSGSLRAAASTLAKTSEAKTRLAEANTIVGDSAMTDQAEDPRITRARLAGPTHVTKNATVAEMGHDGTLNVLSKGTNEWICTPGNENKIGDPPMCLNPMGMKWMMDAMQGKPKPSNEAPGIIYMLCGATQRSNTDPGDRTSPAIPIGPHWMVTWPFDAEGCGLPTTVRDKGAWIMFAGTPFAYLHVCEDPWQGNEYHVGDKAIWTMRYEGR